VIKENDFEQDEWWKRYKKWRRRVQKMPSECLLLENRAFNVQEDGHKNVFSLEMCYDSISESTKEEEEDLS
jgi:hypothetical protein